MTAAVGFPSSRSCLWDSTQVGGSSDLRICSKHVCVNLRSTCLLPAWKLACSSSKALVSCFLIGRTLSIQDGIFTLEVDRFLPKKTDNLSTLLLPCDLVIPCDVVLSSEPSTVTHLLYNLSTFHHAFSSITQSMNTISSLDVGRVFAMKCFECLTLLVACIAPEDSIICAPIRDIPIVPTALARNLATSLSLSALQNMVKYGHMTMDRSRKLLLLLHSDPKVNQLPLVGVWLSGVESTGDVRVWMVSQQYCASASQRDIVWHEDGGFLVLIFTSGSTSPILLHCRANHLSDQFELYHTKVFPEEVALGSCVCLMLDPVPPSSALHTLFVTTRRTYGTATALEGPQPSPQPTPHPSEAYSMVRGSDLLSVSLSCGAALDQGASTVGLEANTAEHDTFMRVDSGTSKCDCSQDTNKQRHHQDNTSCSSNRVISDDCGDFPCIIDDRGGSPCIIDDRGGSPCITDAKQDFEWSTMSHANMLPLADVTTYNQLLLSPTPDVSSTHIPNIPATSDTILGNMSFASMEYLRRYKLLDSEEVDIPDVKLLSKLL